MLTLPDFPNDNVLTEEPEEFEFSMPATPPSSSSATSTPNEPTVQNNQQTATGERSESNADSRFDYVVDRNYGVEV